jgi:hypothetical protein
LAQGIKMEQFFARSFHLKKRLKTVSVGVNSKISKSKADESHILNEVRFTVVLNGLTQNQSLTFSKLKLNKKRKSKRRMRLLKIKCTNTKLALSTSQSINQLTIIYDQIIRFYNACRFQTLSI